MKNYLPHNKAALSAAFVFLGLLLLFPINATAKNNSKVNDKKPTYSFSNPDFAFPETVEKGADKRLDEAVRSRNGVDALRGAIQVIVARNLISGSSFQKNVDLTDSVGNLMPQPYKSLFLLLQAGMYAQKYNTNQWTFNGRTLPLDSYPTDVNAWSGNLFAKKVLQLIQEAQQGMDVAESIPISEIMPVLRKPDGADFSGLSVADFMALYSVGQLRNFNSFSAENVIPFRKDNENVAVSPMEKCAQMARQIIDSRISAAGKSGNNKELVFFLYSKSQDLFGDEKSAFLKEWKDKLIDTPEGGMLLSLYFDAVGRNGYVGSADSKLLYSRMKAWLEKYQTSEYAKAVRYDIAKLQQKSASIDLPSSLYPGVSGRAKVSARNVGRLYALIYKVPDNLLKDGSLIVKNFPGASKCVAVLPVELEGEVPFSAEKNIEIPGLSAGNYVVIPSSADKLTADWRNRVEKWSLQVFHVTNLDIVTTSNSRMENSGIAYVVDAMTQQPVEGAEVICIDNNKKVIKTGLTDKDGGIAIPIGYYDIRAKKDGNTASLWNRVAYSKPTDKKENRADIFTDLSIYRPGDSIKFTMVAWTVSQEKSALRENTGVKVVLHDANFNEKDSLSFTTDEWGRCNGVFKIPADGLLGTYQLAVEYRDNPGKRVCYKPIEVAEYKTPSFYVELQKDSTSTYLPGEMIKFKGIVKTYSGMTLAGVEVRYDVRWSPWWRFRSRNGSASYGSKTLTDGNGEFVVELPTENLKGTEYEYGIYTLTATATSESGETQSASDLRFALGSDVSIRPQIDDKTLVTGDSIRFNVPVYDMLDLPIIRDVEYRIAPVADPSKVLSGVFKSPSLVMASSKLPSGEYYLEFNISGDTLKSGVKTVVYRNDDVKCPAVTPLWVPETEIVAKTGAKSVNVKVGSGYSGSYILCVVSTGNGIVSRRWLSPSEDMINVDVPLVGSDEKMWVTFSGLHDFNQKLAIVAIVPESSLRKMEVKTSVFRDKITAGDKEEWKFTFAVDGDVQKDIPAFAVMSDKALNALAPFSWRLNNWISQRGSATNVSLNYPETFRTQANFSSVPRYAGVEISSPAWNTYGYSLAGEMFGRVMLTSMKVMDSGASSRGANMMAVKEDAVEEVAPMMYKSANYAAADLAEEQVAVAGDADGASVNTQDVEMRPVEMPLAFFMPRLNADEEGVVTVAFDVPNYNTTWQFQLLGYNEELMSANVILDTQASKSVMVRSNPPRFVRTGDVMTVVATLFNNTGSDLAVGGKIELYDPSSGSVIYSENFKAEKVTPSGNRTVTLRYAVADNLSAIGFRAYALTDKFSDGEQTVIPVLPSSSPVVESTQYYLNTGETEFKTRLPKYSKDANVTLKYCDNPIWECLLALPGISTPDSKNIFSVVRSLFANSMSQNVVEKYPQVKESLSKVFADNDTTLLTSNLQKDSGLKTVALNNTPWLNDAASETARMQSLDKLLDKTTVDASVKSLLWDLKNMQGVDGGWSWCPDMRSSYFITRGILAKLGVMKQSGCLPEDGEQMARNAIAYCDAKAYDEYLKSDKKFSVQDMLNYLYARSFFDNVEGKTGFRDLRKKALKKISEEWRDFSIYGKATAAMLLHRSGGYEPTARMILESLDQYATKDGAKGWWFDNLSSGFTGMPKLLTTATALQAYDEIQPSADAVEGLRQWLVLQKETENWGDNPYTVEVIAAIMGSGVDWTASSEPASFRIDGKELDTAGRQMLTGLVTLDLDPKKVSGKELIITKHSANPAWGGVLSQYVAPIQDVKEESSPNLKIEKKLLVVKTTPSGETATEGEIHVGDKVRVTLTLTCDKDMDYVAVVDERGAFLEPADQISGYSAVDNMFLYKEVRDTRTSFFIGFLPKGVSVLTYDCYADREGEYSVGIASTQSQYSPLQTAHSAGEVVVVKAAR